jgi:hypothetical protein
MVLKIVAILFLLVVLALVWMIFVPVQLYIDTDSNVYQVRQVGTFSGSAYYQNGFRFRVCVLGIEINTSPKEGVQEMKAKPKASKKTSIEKPTEAWLSLLRGIFRSVSIKKLVVDLDTGDVVLNAKLVPLFMLARYKGIHASTNFMGRVYAHIEVNAYINKMLWAYFKFSTIKK